VSKFFVLLYFVCSTPSAYYIFPDKLLDLMCYDGSQWFGFDPFCEIINPYNEELDLSLTRSE